MIKKLEHVPADITIEPAVPDDATAIMTIKRDGWLQAYVSPEYGVTEEDVRSKLDDQGMTVGIANWRRGLALEKNGGPRRTFVAKENGVVVGFTAPKILDGQRRIGALYVAPASCSRGIGSALLRKALEWHGENEDVYLHVVSYNVPAIRLYERFGFVMTGKVFPGGVDEEIGIKNLPESEMVLRLKQ